MSLPQTGEAGGAVAEMSCLQTLRSVIPIPVTRNVGTGLGVAPRGGGCVTAVFIHDPFKAMQNPVSVPA